MVTSTGGICVYHSVFPLGQIIIIYFLVGANTFVAKRGWDSHFHTKEVGGDWGDDVVNGEMEEWKTMAFHWNSSRHQTLNHMASWNPWHHSQYRIHIVWINGCVMIFITMIGLVSFYCNSGNLSCPNFTRKEDKFGAKFD